jgi:condensin complex subunit 1
VPHLSDGPLRAHADDDMDVDDDDDEASQGEDEDEEEAANDEDAIIDDDAAAGSARKKPKKKKSHKRRKSELDLTALTDEQAALAALQNNELLHLRLRRKYCAEALSFMRQIENALPQLEKLLGSTSKPEVLETMDFFRFAFEYQIANAEVCALVVQLEPTSTDAYPRQVLERCSTLSGTRIMRRQMKTERS